MSVDPDQVIRGVPAPVIAKVVDGIVQADGVCHPSALVAAARPKSSPIHDLFTWDNREAAEAYRLVEARRTLRTIRVVREEGADRPQAPVYVSVTRVEKDSVTHGYVPTVQLSEKDRVGVIRDVEAQLRGLRNRHGALTQFKRVWRVIDEEVGDGSARRSDPEAKAA